MKKFILFATFLLSLFFSAIAQKIEEPLLIQLRKHEDSLKKIAPAILQSPDYNMRKQKDSAFTKMLVRALKIRHSFRYHFDSLTTVSIQYAPDSSFRLFTWQVMIDEDNFRHKGAIQMKTIDGNLKLIPLLDQSDFINNQDDTVLNAKNWFGAICYKIIKTDFNDKEYYSLLEFDENNSQTNKKIIEVLHFENGEPIFGGAYFKAGTKDSAYNPLRYIIEYKAGAAPRLNYDEDLKMIIKEHLISENNNPNDKSTLVGDGDYEGFVWSRGKWVYTNKIFNQTTPEGEVPVPSPLQENGELKQ